ncbi:MAG: Gp138 family membrane-puncturing spike protein, partial [Candidatus Pacearchaeota archaeon]|nr:Gp138 family membrane-puncturing spike protein [Candidatus Pacearchaeota archaeon]
IPSRSEANDDTLAGVFREILRKHSQGLDDMLPAVVETHDRAANRVKVRPLIALVTTGKAVVSRASIPSVPVLRLGGGGFFVSFPLAAGDFGWVKATDRDISLFLQSLEEAKPNTKRMHSFEDAVFIPDVIRSYDIDAADSNSLVIQSTNGSTKFALKDGEITLKADVLKYEGDVDVTGSVTATGDITSDGTVTGKTEVVAKEAALAVGLSTHVHVSGVPTTPTNPPTPGT